MRSEQERLDDILQAIIRIKQYTAKHIFERDKLTQDGILYQLLIIGEAVRSLPSDFREKYAYIPWTSIIGMRNILIHEYFAINIEIVWGVVAQKLPELSDNIKKILKQIS
ncbi:MAG: hypothetical protein BWK80_43495 [Desulfobacteraceae bacterium IS3]|nr:MAG: hypothetical protein BWK80_43495 [Desulfobacteraceae bacterium IS3]HAO20950.1 nucleotidyltransferase [Desulfobacteraceae bacterium]